MHRCHCPVATHRLSTAAGPGHLGRKVQPGPRDVPRASADGHGHASITACTRRRNRGRSPLVTNLSGVRAVIWSADAVATATRASPKLQHVRGWAADTEQTFSSFATGSHHPSPHRQRKANPRSEGLCGAPWRDRTAYLLLTVYPRLDAVANCRDAGQVRGGALCCRPTYLFITPARLGGDPIEAGYRG
jgi:hypothetical protein